MPYTRNKQMLPFVINPTMLTIFVICFHIPLLFLPSVNLEFAFRDAANYFATSNRDLIEQYFFYQANTLGQPFLAWLVSNIVNGLDYTYILRMLSVLSIIPYAAGIYRFSKYLNPSDDPSIVILYSLLNPLVWVFAARGTADFTPAALAIYALSYFG